MASVDRGLAILFVSSEAKVTPASPQPDASNGGAAAGDNGWYGAPRADLIGTFIPGRDYQAFRFSPSLSGVFEGIPAAIPADTVPPVVDTWGPAGTVAPATPITFHVTDNLSELALVCVFAILAGSQELVYDGTSFSANYNAASSSVPIAGGFAFSINRDAGWPDGVTIQVVAVDQDGNITTATQAFVGPLAPSGIASGEAFGTPQINQTIHPAGIAPGAFGDVAINPGSLLESAQTNNALFGSKPFVIAVRWNGNTLSLGSAAASPVFKLRHNSISYVTDDTLTWTPVTSDQVLLFCHDGTDLFVRRDGVELARAAVALAALPTDTFLVGKCGNVYMDGAIKQIVAVTDTFPTQDQIEQLEKFLKESP